MLPPYEEKACSIQQASKGKQFQAYFAFPEHLCQGTTWRSLSKLPGSNRGPSGQNECADETGTGSSTSTGSVGKDKLFPISRTSRIHDFEALFVLLLVSRFVRTCFGKYTSRMLIASWKMLSLKREYQSLGKSSLKFYGCSEVGEEFKGALGEIFIGNFSM